MNLFEKWNSISLIKRILCGMVVGIILALIIPQVTIIGTLGTLFVNALMAIAPVLVFVLVTTALARTVTGGGKTMGRIVLLYLIGTFAAAVCAVLLCTLFTPTLPLEGAEAVTGYDVKTSIFDVLGAMIAKIITNPLGAIVGGNFLGILVWGIVFGIAFRRASDKTKDFLKEVADAVSLVIKWVISLAPFGVLGLVFTAVSQNGLSIFIDYGILLAILVGCMAFVALVMNPIIVFTQIRQNPYPLVFKCLKESFVTAFFTRSSAANIPVNMELCKSLGLDEKNYSTSIPLGATINMAGAAITITVMTLACVNTLGIEVPLLMKILLSFVAALGACGASGVAGGSLLLIPMACSLFGIPPEIAMQVVGIGFVIGVVQDSCETGLNSSTDALFTAAAEFHDRKAAGEEIKF
ncbi:serine/threonine transporter SstT [Methanocorpusculum sp.]|nr:serine/threonine transporter SstT [Methanocorpusculum sp.]